MIGPARSKFKKETNKYTKDALFDIIDIQACLDKNKNIPKIEKNMFLYNLMQSEDNDNNSPNYENVNVIDSCSIKPEYHKINRNRFGLKIEEIILHYENGYKIPLVEKYPPVEILGEGASSTVIKAYDKIKKKYIAIKIIVVKNKQQEKNQGSTTYESKIHFKLDHTNILKLYDVIINEDYIFMFIELMNGGSLRDLIIERYKSDSNSYLFRDSECALIIKGILEGINYLHSMEIMHRDLKPENILFESKDDLSSLKIADFGLALQQEKNNQKCGTLLYMPPEAILNKSYDDSFDIFSIGFILYILCSGGRHPVLTNDINPNEREYVELFKVKIKSWTFPDPFPLLARNLFFKLCKFSTWERYEAYKALKHPWITRNQNSLIPETLFDTYMKMELILKFKKLISNGIVLYVYKAANQNLFGSFYKTNKNSIVMDNNDYDVKNIKIKSFLKCNTVKNSKKKLLPKIIINDIMSINNSNHSKKCDSQLPSPNEIYSDNLNRQFNKTLFNSTEINNNTIESVKFKIVKHKPKTNSYINSKQISFRKEILEKNTKSSLNFKKRFSEIFTTKRIAISNKLLLLNENFNVNENVNVNVNTPSESTEKETYTHTPTINKIKIKKSSNYLGLDYLSKFK